MNLKDAHITGYGTNPIGDSVCHHCGMGLKHLVFVRDPETGKEVIIGSKCAERVGVDFYALRRRLTSAQAAKKREREAKRAEAEREQWERDEAERQARRVEQLKPIQHIIDQLREINSGFHNSLADQLESRFSLSYRQAEFVCKALVGSTGRRNKKNADAWDDMIDLLCK